MSSSRVFAYGAIQQRPEPAVQASIPKQRITSRLLAPLKYLRNTVNRFLRTTETAVVDPTLGNLELPDALPSLTAAGQVIYQELDELPDAPPLEQPESPSSHPFAAAPGTDITIPDTINPDSTGTPAPAGTLLPASIPASARHVTFDLHLWSHDELRDPITTARKRGFSSVEEAEQSERLKRLKGLNICFWRDHPHEWIGASAIRDISELLSHLWHATTTLSNISEPFATLSESPSCDCVYNHCTNRVGSIIRGQLILQGLDNGEAAWIEVANEWAEGLQIAKNWFEQIYKSSAIDKLKQQGKTPQEPIYIPVSQHEGLSIAEKFFNRLIGVIEEGGYLQTTVETESLGLVAQDIYNARAGDRIVSYVRPEDQPEEDPRLAYSRRAALAPRSRNQRRKGILKKPRIPQSNSTGQAIDGESFRPIPECDPSRDPWSIVGFNSRKRVEEYQVPSSVAPVVDGPVHQKGAGDPRGPYWDRPGTYKLSSSSSSDTSSDSPGDSPVYQQGAGDPRGPLWDRPGTYKFPSSCSSDDSPGGIDVNGTEGVTTPVNNLPMGASQSTDAAQAKTAAEQNTATAQNPATIHNAATAHSEGFFHGEDIVQGEANAEHISMQVERTMPVEHIMQPEEAMVMELSTQAGHLMEVDHSMQTEHRMPNGEATPVRNTMIPEQAEATMPSLQDSPLLHPPLGQSSPGSPTASRDQTSDAQQGPPLTPSKRALFRLPAPNTKNAHCVSNTVSQDASRDGSPDIDEPSNKAADEIFSSPFRETASAEYEPTPKKPVRSTEAHRKLILDYLKDDSYNIGGLEFQWNIRSHPSSILRQSSPSSSFSEPQHSPEASPERSPWVSPLASLQTGGRGLSSLQELLPEDPSESELESDSETSANSSQPALPLISVQTDSQHLAPSQEPSTSTSRSAPVTPRKASHAASDPQTLRDAPPSQSKPVTAAQAPPVTPASRRPLTLAHGQPPSIERLRISTDKVDDIALQEQLHSEVQSAIQRRHSERRKKKEEEERLARTGGLREPRRPIVPEITDAGWEQRIDDTLRARDNHELAKADDGTAIKGRDFKQVVPPTVWLNDEIINGALSLLMSHVNTRSGIENIREQTPKCVLLNTHFWTNISSAQPRSTDRWLRRVGVRRDNFRSVETFLIPINLGNSHWTLGIVRPHVRTIAHMDSLGRTGAGSPRVAGTILKWVKEFLKEDFVPDEWTVRDYESPQQTNGHDCGVHTITNAMCVALGIDPSEYKAEDMPTQRRRIAGALLNGGFSGEFDLSHL